MYNKKIVRNSLNYFVICEYEMSAQDLQQVLW